MAVFGQSSKSGSVSQSTSRRPKIWWSSISACTRAVTRALMSSTEATPSGCLSMSSFAASRIQASICSLVICSAIQSCSWPLISLFSIYLSSQLRGRDTPKSTRHPSKAGTRSRPAPVRGPCPLAPARGTLSPLRGWLAPGETRQPQARTLGVPDRASDTPPGRGWPPSPPVFRRGPRSSQHPSWHPLKEYGPGPPVERNPGPVGTLLRRHALLEPPDEVSGLEAVHVALSGPRLRHGYVRAPMHLEDVREVLMVHIDGLEAF